MYASLPGGRVSVHKKPLPCKLCSPDQSRSRPCSARYPTDRHRFLWSHLSAPAAWRNKPAPQQSSAYESRKCCCLRIYSRSLQEFPISFPGSRHVPGARDGTSYRSHESPEEWEYRRWYHPVPASPVPRRIYQTDLPLS